MTDIFDHATEREEKERELAIAYRKPEGPPACKVYYWCGEAVEGGRRFCNRECAADWQFAEDRK